MRRDNFELREEQISAKVKHPFSVLYLSDFHFNAHSLTAAHWMLEQIDTLKPDIILLGGDYVDTRRGLNIFEFFLSNIPHPDNCFAVAGNHDYFFGINTLKKLLTNYGVTWIEKSFAFLNLKTIRIRIDGNLSQSAIDNDFSILCAHKPQVLNGELSNYQLALAGHLHGSQVVLWQNEKGLFPGRFFYKWNILTKKISGCTCYISKGLGDTLPVRFNCKKDAIFVKVRPTPI
ncbi:metallophosphoesterase [Lewinella cohaerens]|uniref:metallophosphoesterase n=1 Tax=Lewinella cohaerens TaxID=70995 RepID=UPI000362B106|nr:metallophosphoesterase [Lewinella cohaerens]